MADVTRHDAAASFNADSSSYVVTAGTDRALIVGLQHEGDITPDSISITWGGQAMTQLVTQHVEAGGNDNEVVLFLLLEAGIAAGVGTTIVVTGELPDFTIHAASYENVNQTGGATSVPETNSDSTDAATPNPLTGSDIVAGDGAAVVALAGVGNDTTSTWQADLTEQTEQADTTPTCTGSLADGLFATGQNVSVEATWVSQNRAVVCAIELAPTDDAGPIAATPSLAFSLAALLTAQGDLAAAAALAFSAVADLGHQGRIEAAAALAITAAADLDGIGQLAAAPAMSVSSVARIRNATFNTWYKSGEIVVPAMGTSVVDTTDKGTDPFGIHFFWTDNVTDQVIEAHAELGHGFSDGTNHRAVMHNAEDGVSNNLRQSSITACALIVNPVDDAIQVEATVTFQANTFTVTYTTQAAGFRLHYEVWGGTHGGAVVGDVGADASPLTGLGLERGDLFLGFTSGEQFPASSQFAYQSYGAACQTLAGIVQWCLFKYMGDNDEDEQGSALTSTDFMGQYDVDFADWTIQITALSGDGATWTGSNADHFAFMMLDLGGMMVDAGTMTKTTDVMAGVHTFPALDFIPQGYAVASGSEVNEDRTVNQNCRGSFGAFDGTGTGHSINAITTVDANTPRDSLSHSANVINMGQDFGGGNVQSEGQAQAITNNTPQIIFSPNTNQAEIIGFYAFERSPAGAISAQAQLAITAVANLTGDGQLDAAAQLAITAAADLRAQGQLDAAAQLTITAVALLVARGALDAAAQLAITAVANLTADGALNAAAQLAITAAADLRAGGALDAAAQLTFAAVADLTAAVGAIEAQAQLTITAAANLTADGALDAAAALAITAAADLRAQGALDAAAQITFAAVADLRATGQLDAAAQLAFALAADLKAAGALSAAAQLTLTAAADLRATGALTAAADIAIAVAADLKARGALDAAATLLFAITADLVDAGGNLAAAPTLAFAPVADLTATGALDAAAALTLTAAADLKAQGQLEAAAALAFAVAADLQARGQLDAAAAIAFAVAADLQAAGELSAQAALAFAVAADLQAQGKLDAATTLVFAAVANLTDADAGAIAAAAQMQFQLAADLTAAGALDATGTMIFSAVANLLSQGNVEAAAQLAFTLSADLKARGTLDANVAMTFAAVADLRARGELEAAAALAFAVAADLRARGDLEAAATLLFSVAADLKAAGTLAAGPSLVFSAAANLAARGKLDAAAQLTFAAVANLTDQQGPIFAAAQLTFAAVADLKADGALAAAPALLFDIAADLTSAGPLAASPALAFAVAADLRAQGELQATASLTFTPTANLVAQGALTAAALLSFSISAILTIAGAEPIPNSTQLFLGELFSSFQSLTGDQLNSDQTLVGGVNSEGQISG